MAVWKPRISARRSALALAMAAIALPGLASADPWDGRGNGRQQRSEGERPERQQRQQAPQQAPQQAQPQRSWSPPPPSQQRAPATPPQSRNWNGGEVRTQSAPPPQGAQPGTNWTRTTRNWDNRGEPDRNRDRDQNRERDWNRDRNANRGGVNWTDVGNRDRDRDQHRDRDRYRDRDGGWRTVHNDGDGRRWDRRWRDNHRYDWRVYRSSHPSIYRLQPYYVPYRGYYYRRLSIGFFLDALFFDSRYWIDDPWYYRLPEAYGPYRWVRYYDDALLVNIYTGEVVDVIYDVFW